MVGVPKFWDEEAWMFKNSTCEPSVMVSSLLAIGLLVGVVLSCTPPSESTRKVEQANSSSPKPPPWDKSPAAQATRLKFINQGIRVGVINRIEITNGFLGHQIADAWVRPGFYRLTYDQKLALAKMIYQYHFADESPSLMFTDTMSGKIIGTFTPGLGLSMD